MAGREEDLPTLSSASRRSELTLVGSAPELDAALRPFTRASHASRRAYRDVHVVKTRKISLRRWNAEGSGSAYV